MRSRLHLRSSFYFLLAFVFCATVRSAHAQSPNCSAADPDDNNDDYEALQGCLDNQSTVYLEPGNPGYIITHRLIFNDTNTVLSSVGGKARIIAGPGLDRAMLEVEDPVDGYEISELILDGNRDNRTEAEKCVNPDIGQIPGSQGPNLVAQGTNYVLHHIDTINAMCGSGLGAKGIGFEIHSIYSANNGHELGHPLGGGFADGMTLLHCFDSYIHDNVITENTDVGLVNFRGTGCIVRFNEIENQERYQFAGINVGGQGGESHEGSEYKDNEITSGYDKMGFGIIVGFHPWDANVTVEHAGTVRDNTITGAVVNLAVDGIADGVVEGNTMSGAQGSTGMHCSISANYTVAHYGSATLQSGWDAARYYHAGGCGTP